jgi:hypothetical protein
MFTVKNSITYISNKKVYSNIYNFPHYRRVYPKVFELAAWSKNCKWYSSLPLDAVVSLSYESVW